MRAPGATAVATPDDDAPRPSGEDGAADAEWGGRGPALVLLGAATAVGAVLRVSLAVGDHSVYWPDEVHKTLEPAHRLAFGYGLQAWEFAEGAVSWTLPGLLAGALRLLSAVGLGAPGVYVPVLRLVLVGLGLVAVVGTYALARAHRAPPWAAALGGVLAALAAPALYFSHRLLTETASLAPVVVGLALGLRPNPRRWQVAGGAGLLALAVFFRLHNALFCAGLLATLAARRQWRSLATAGAVLAGAAAAYGVLDWATWGSPFHSAFEYGRFSLVERRAAGFGTAPFGYYGSFLARSLGPALVPLGLLALASVARAPGLFLLTAGFVLVHSLEPHKEVRFVLPALPLLCALVGIGAWVVVRWCGNRGLARVAVVATVVATAAVSSSRHRGLTYADVGQAALFDPRASAYFHGDSVNRLLLAAHRRADLCGLHVVPEMRGWTGGYSYLHRPVPLYGSDTPPPPGAANYAVDVGGRGDQQVVARDGGLVLERLSAGPCRPDPGFSDRLR